MKRIEFKTDVHFALSHFALYGAAAILQSQLGTRATVRWVGLEQAEIVLYGKSLTEEQVAQALHQHATAHLTSWVQDMHEHRTATKTVSVGTFSPRIAQAADRAAWRALQTARHALIDRALGGRQWLDLAFIQALGEPAYWFTDATGKVQPDRGASGWEMKTRNRGEEFVQHRLARLAREVAAREPIQVLHGLRGLLMEDEAGGNAVDSRTPTGLRPPYPTDNALAWCALWGMALFPMVHRAIPDSFVDQRVGRPSVTSAFLRPRSSEREGLRRAWVILPRLDRPTGLATLKSILLGAQLIRILEAARKGQTNDAQRSHVQYDPKDVAWLRAKGVGGYLVADQVATDNPNAPELSIQKGRLVPLLP